MEDKDRYLKIIECQQGIIDHMSKLSDIMTDLLISQEVNRFSLTVSDSASETIEGGSCVST